MRLIELLAVLINVPETLAWTPTGVCGGKCGLREERARRQRRDDYATGGYFQSAARGENRDQEAALRAGNRNDTVATISRAIRELKKRRPAGRSDDSAGAHQNLTQTTAPEQSDAARSGAVGKGRDDATHTQPIPRAAQGRDGDLSRRRATASCSAAACSGAGRSRSSRAFTCVYDKGDNPL